MYATLSEVPVSAVTADQLAAAVKAADVPLFSFHSRSELVTRVLLAAWPRLTLETLPDEARDAAVTATFQYRRDGAEAILAALTAAAPHMPAA